MERVRFITHRSRDILFIDYSELQDTEEILRTIQQAKEIIAQQPENSVRVLTYVRDAKSDARVTQAMKEFAAHNKPYVCASAVVGMSPVHRIIFEAVRLFTKREIHAFDDLTPAKEWLTQQSTESATEESETVQQQTA